MTEFQNALVENFSKTYPEIFHFAYYASRRYKIYSIPKKNGGTRKIAHPSAKLKEYQRFIVSEIFSKYPVHDAVYSYRNKRNVKAMALQHVNSKYLLRIDFADFFPSIQAKHIRYFLNDSNKIAGIPTLTNNDITLINLLVCKGGVLTIGAPSSPMISNTIIYALDSYLHAFCIKSDITYTRYADDLYFSTNHSNLLHTVIPILKQYLSDYFINLKINESKTINTSKKHRRIITGLTITTNNQVSVGRQQKRYIRSLIHKYIQGAATSEQVNYLRGYLSYIHSIEPQYIHNLENKYTVETISDLIPTKSKTKPR